VQDVLYNSLLCQANYDLAEICRILGADPTRFSAWAEQIAESIESKLWDEEHLCYFDYDLVAGEPIRTRVGPGFSPLYAGIPSKERAAQMCESLLQHGVRFDETTWALPSVPPGDASFLPTNYWRGPVWVNVNWVLYHGLRRYAFHDLADDLRRAMIELPRRFGFHEHFDPTTGHGHGEAQFSWTAALVLDLLFEDVSSLPGAEGS
jgi:glycogen debranching enzyme